MHTTSSNPLWLCAPCWIQHKLRAFHPLLPSSKLRFCSGNASTDEEETAHDDSWAGEMAVTTKEICHKLQEDKEDELRFVSKCNQHRYHEDFITPNYLVSLLKAYTEKKDVHEGIRMHSAVVRRGLLQRNVFLGSTLVNMYAKCGALPKAQQVFDELRVHNVVVWNSLITAYAQQGLGEEALRCLEKMQSEGLLPDALTFTCIMKACGAIRALDKGLELHDEVVKYGLLEEDIVAGTALVDMYAKCGLLGEAQQAFEGLQNQDIITWNALIAGYTQHGYGEEALGCFELMQRGGHFPNAATFVCILTACGSIEALEKGQAMHADIVKNGFLQEGEVGTALLGMYLKCDMLEEAAKVFNELSVRNKVTWSALIVGCAQQGYSEEAIGYFTRMHCESLCSNVGALACILKGCGTIGALSKGQELHAQIVGDGLLEKEMIVGTALLDMYAMCGVIETAREVFNKLPGQDVVSWTTLIGGYVQHGQCAEALHCFEQMQLGGIPPNVATFVCILKACSSIGFLAEGQKIHAQIVRKGLLTKGISGNTCTEEVFGRIKADNEGHNLQAQIRRNRLLEKDIVVGTALVDMYVKCGMLTEGQDVFDELPIHDVVLWNAIISGHTQFAHVEEALSCFECMQLRGVSPDSVTFSCILKVYGSIGAVQKGQKLLDGILKGGLVEHDMVVGNALVDMYASFGMIAEAQGLFDKMAIKDVISWNALLAGYTQLGKNYAFNLFDKMVGVGQSPDTITFTCLLNGCSHMGLLEKGQLVLETVTLGYNVNVTLEHYNCMVDSLGRAGCIEKMVAIINSMPFSANLVMWHIVLAACQHSLDVELGRWAFEHAIELDGEDVEAYVCMSNIIAATGRHEDAIMIEAMSMPSHHASYCSQGFSEVLLPS